MAKLRECLEENNINHEVIFVDDGSSDRTFDEVCQLPPWSALKVLRLSSNLGSGGAIKEALKIAQGEWYGWLPCDLEIMPSEILYPFSLRSQSDVVVTFFNNGQGTRNWLRRILSPFFTGIINTCFQYNIPYYNGFSLIRRELIIPGEVRSNGFFFHAELLIRTIAKTNKVVSAPIRLTPRQAGHTKAISFKVFRDVISCFLHTIWDLKFRFRGKSALP